MVGNDVVGGNVVGGNVDADGVVAAELDFSVRRVVVSFSGVVGLTSAGSSPPPDFHTTKCH